MPSGHPARHERGAVVVDEHADAVDAEARATDVRGAPGGARREPHEAVATRGAAHDAAHHPLPNKQRLETESDAVYTTYGVLD